MADWVVPSPPSPDREFPLVGPDRPILEGMLAWQRRTLLSLCAGLTGEQLCAAPLPSTNLTLLGLVRHLAKVERIWFRERAGGLDLPPMYVGTDGDFKDLSPSRAPEDLARYAEECRLADAIAAGLPFEHTFVSRGETFSLRMVYVHLVSEYGRHNGHGDLIRQAIDGATGR